MSVRGLDVAIAIPLVAIFLSALVASGCSRRLVAADGRETVKVYQSEDVYKAAVDIRKAMGRQKNDAEEKFVGFLNSLADHEYKEVTGETRVRIISKDALGAQVELLEGPHQGYIGFVRTEDLR